MLEKVVSFESSCRGKKAVSFEASCHARKKLSCLKQAVFFN
jgi:hypothetical protein